MDELNFLTTSELSQSIRERKVSAVEVLDAHLAAAEQIAIVTGGYQRPPGY